LFANFEGISQLKKLAEMPYLTIISKNQKFFCQYDEQDREIIDSHKWHLSGGYVCTYINGKSVPLHRLLMQVEKPLIVDHKDGNPLNNTRANLRICTHAQNIRNSRKHKGRIPYKGVYMDLNKYHVQITFDGKVRNLGRFRSPITAGRIYDRAARALFKDFAYLNFVGADIEATQLTMF
jgi:hypothetical protein